MGKLFHIDDVVNSPSKLAILRVLTLRQGLKATGSQIARLSGYSVPSTHESLKDLYSRNILKLDIIGNQHIYTLNEEDRTVKKVIRPMFEFERGFKDEIRDFIVKEMRLAKINTVVKSVFLYGSVQTNTSNIKSDVDIAVVVNESTEVKLVSDMFVSVIAQRFKAYFGAQLDAYVKNTVEFRERLRKQLPPLSDLMKSYTVLYGKEPLEV